MLKKVSGNRKMVLDGNTLKIVTILNHMGKYLRSFACLILLNTKLTFKTEITLYCNFVTNEEVGTEHQGLPGREADSRLHAKTGGVGYWKTDWDT